MKMGYPENGYPPVGYPPPLQGAYPGYPYAAAPTTAYYNNADPAASYESGPYSTVRRLVIAMTATLVVLSVLFFLVLLVRHPREPVFNIDTLSVSNFSIIDSQLDANWDVNVKILNPNSKLDMDCKDIDVLIYYQKNLLSTTTLQPFLLEKKKESSFHSKLVTRQDYVEGEMEESMKSRVVIVNVRIRLTAGFENGGASARDQKLTALCANLRLYIDGNTGHGKLAPGPWHCTVYEV